VPELARRSDRRLLLSCRRAGSRGHGRGRASGAGGACRTSTSAGRYDRRSSDDGRGRSARQDRGPSSAARLPRRSAAPTRRGSGRTATQRGALVSISARRRTSSSSLIAFTCSCSSPSRSGRRWASRSPAAGFERRRPSSTAVARRARTGATHGRTVFGASAFDLPRDGSGCRPSSTARLGGYSPKSRRRPHRRPRPP
jgi:hypothetical protein